jgi:fido (protein-threonine AMPylation protein)
MHFQYAPGATPLDPDEAAGLIPSHIATQSDLNVWEEANILQSARWAMRQKKRDILDEGFLRDLLDNTRYQIEHQTFDLDELVVRFHHRLVWIHVFPNGNGRHARLAADVLAMRLGLSRFSWGGNLLTSGGVLRQNYLEALRAADAGRMDDLLYFARN